MAYSIEDKRKAQDLYVNQGKSYREVSKIIGVSLKIVSLEWSKKDWFNNVICSWSSLRDITKVETKKLKSNTPTETIKEVKQIIEDKQDTNITNTNIEKKVKSNTNLLNIETKEVIVNSDILSNNDISNNNEIVNLSEKAQHLDINKKDTKILLNTQNSFLIQLKHKWLQLAKKYKGEELEYEKSKVYTEIFTSPNYRRYVQNSKDIGLTRQTLLKEEKEDKEMLLIQQNIYKLQELESVKQWLPDEVLAEMELSIKEIK